MLMEIAVGVIIVIGILGFIGYSYMIKQQSMRCGSSMRILKKHTEKNIRLASACVKVLFLTKNIL